MDLFKKFFGIEPEADDSKKSLRKNQFRKPIWFEEYDTDDELFDNSKIFGFDVFSNPLEMQKLIESQVQELIKNFEDMEGATVFDKNVQEEFFKPSFDFDQLSPQRRGEHIDSDLDGEVYVDQLQTLLQRISPEMNALMQNDNPNMTNNTVKKNKTDDEKILDRIHGLFKEEEPVSRPNRRAIMKGPPAPGSGSPPFSGTFQIFSESIVEKTIQKPDGSIESHRTVRDRDGNSKTTITRTKNGHTETIVTDNKQSNVAAVGKTLAPAVELPSHPSDLQLNDYLFVNKQGYTLPKNMW